MYPPGDPVRRAAIQLSKRARASEERLVNLYSDQHILSTNDKERLHEAQEAIKVYDELLSEERAEVCASVGQRDK